MRAAGARTPRRRSAPLGRHPHGDRARPSGAPRIPLWWKTASPGNPSGMVGYARVGATARDRCVRSSAHSLRRHVLELRPARDHPAQHVAELCVRLGADLACVPLLDVGDDLIAEQNLIESTLGGEDQLRAAIRGVRAALDVAELLELVDDAPNDLLVATRKAG